MSVCVSWEFIGLHQNGLYLTDDEVRELISCNPADWEGRHWEKDDQYLAAFRTESFRSCIAAKKALTRYAENHPDIVLQVTYQYENSVCPDGFLIEDGKLRDVTGHVYYTANDTGKELDWM